jgi:ribosomal protein S18 acetylase RimI-like enzyme
VEPNAIRPAEAGDLTALDAALKNLSQDLGDPHRAGTDSLRKAVFGPAPSAWAQVMGGPQGLRGLALFSPVFSTARGGAGAYVSDLWVARSERGSGLGTALLQSAADRAATLWGAGYLRLAVHDHNSRARLFYQSLGFEPAEGETIMVLAGQSFRKIRRR